MKAPNQANPLPSHTRQTPRECKNPPIKSKLPFILLGIAVIAIAAFFYWIAQWQGPNSATRDSQGREIAEPRRIPTH